MRRGELYRYRDPSGVSGTGVVALVVEFPPNEDGHQWVAAKWLGPESVHDFLARHRPSAGGPWPPGRIGDPLA